LAKFVNNLRVELGGSEPVLVPVLRVLEVRLVGEETCGKA
jgi:hypothetical protein